MDKRLGQPGPTTTRSQTFTHWGACDVEVEDDRIVRHAVDLGLDDAGGVLDGIARSPVDLRNAAERVWILHAAAVGVRRHDLAVGEQDPHVGGDDLRTRVRPNVVQPLVEGLSAAAESFQRHGCDDVGVFGESSGADQAHRRHGAHVLRAVEEGQTLLGLEFDGFECELCERFFGGESGSFGIWESAWA